MPHLPSQHAPGKARNLAVEGRRGWRASSSIVVSMRAGTRPSWWPNEFAYPDDRSWGLSPSSAPPVARIFPPFPADNFPTHGGNTCRPGGALAGPSIFMLLVRGHGVCSSMMGFTFVSSALCLGLSTWPPGMPHSFRLCWRQRPRRPHC